MGNETDRTCQFCYYEYFDSRAYPCSMCVCGEERTDKFQPKGRQNKRKYEPRTIAEDINRRVEMVKKEWSVRHIKDEQMERSDE